MREIMSAKELVIHLKLDRSHAKAANAAQIADAKALERQYKQTQAVARQQIAETARAERVAAKEKLAGDKAALKAALDAITNEKKAALDAISEGKKARSKAARDSATAAAEASREKAAAEKSAAREASLAAASVANANKAAARASRMAWQEQNKSQIEGANSGIAAVGKLGVAYAALDIGVKIATAISDMWKNQRRDIESSVENMIHYREVILELAALNDRLGRTTPELKNQLEFRSKTLQSRDDAIAFQGGIMDTGQSAVKAELITKPELDKLAEHMGSYQGATGATPDALGKLSGLMPGIIGGKNQTAEDVARKEIAILDILRLGNGGLKTGVSQFANNSGLSKAGLFGHEGLEQASLQSLFSIDSPESAGTRVDQFVRGMSGMQTKNRGTEMEGSETQMEYGKRLGVTDAMKPLEIGRLVAGDLKEQAKNNPAFNPMNYLFMHGFREQEAQFASANFATAVNNGSWDKNYGKMSTGQAVPTFKAAMQETRDHMSVDPTAQARRADLAKDLADSAKATGPEGLFLQAKKIAFENLRLRGETSGTFEKQNESTIWEGQILDEVQRELNESGKKVGLEGIAGDEGNGNPVSRFNKRMGLGTGEGVLGGLPASRLAYSNEMRAKAYAEAYTQIKERGGDPLAATMKEMLDVGKQQLEATKRLEDRMLGGANKVGPQPAPALPPPLPGAPRANNRNP
jgi:hypothetical protein